MDWVSPQTKQYLMWIISGWWLSYGAQHFLEMWFRSKQSLARPWTTTSLKEVSPGFLLKIRPDSAWIFTKWAQSEMIHVCFEERPTPLHYAAIPIKMCQLEIWAKFLPLPPFWSGLIISDKIFEWIFLFSFTFNIYLRDKLIITKSTWSQTSSL